MLYEAIFVRWLGCGGLVPSGRRSGGGRALGLRKARLLRWARAMAVIFYCGSCIGGGVAAAEPEPWSLWDAHAPANDALIDHAAWQGFLDKYLVAHPDSVNRVAYKRVTAADRGQLRGYLEMLSLIDPREFAKAEQLPYWINLYNALTVDVVLRYPGKSSILRMGRSLLPFGPWDDELLSVAGQPITLNDIEHRILRPIWQDHRIHYAVNCASISCPSLAASAYTRTNTEDLLASGERAYINHPRGVRFGPDGGLTVSRIYEWYGEDFAADAAGLLAYLSRHHRSAAKALSAYSGRIDYAYDWSLNQLED